MEEALFLTKFASHVKVIHRRDKLRASKIMQDRAAKNSKISFIWDSVVTDIKDPQVKKVSAVVLRNVKDGTVNEDRCDGVFVALGHEPNTPIFKGQLDMSGGYLHINSGTSGNATQTSVPGVFAAGDVADHVYRQAVTSSGFGCMAALDAEKYLDELST